MLGTTTTEIIGNAVRYNTMRGIYLYYSSPRIYD
ncbi:MAG: hypothetical protein HXY50_00730, partial [Ignavibacteriaceae bacterium]|nr:hypothetical protein [Ignavibacteriaceae bacterium]